MTDINIVELIETNPLTTLSKTYNIKILEKIQAEFSNFEQRLFISSFYCYLNHNLDDFIIDLDNIWNWLGFGQKVNAKRMLLKNFIENKDYIKLETTLNDTIHRIKGGQNKEIFMLNISSFKKFCLKAGTQKADEIHDYYIKLEKIIYDTINEEREELRLQLQNSLQISEYEKKKAIEQTLINQFPLNTECIYFGIIDNTNDDNEKLIKFGHTNNLNVRVMDHRNKYNNFILVEAYKVQNKVEIENLIKAHSKIKKQIRNIIVNDKMKTEIIAYDETNFTINDLKKYIKEIINSRTYSIERFNKLLQDNQDLSDRNEELLNINQELKEELKNYKDIITRQTIDIQTMKETIDKQNILLSENDNVMEKKIEEEKSNENIIIYQNPLLPNDETTNRFNEFIDTMCIVRKDVDESSLLYEYQRWKQQLGKEICDDDIIKIKEYLNNCAYTLKATVHTDKGSNEGYYGIQLKSDEPRYKTTSSTGKKVEKVDNKTKIVLRTWETIAKAAEDENMSKTKMSVSVKKETVYNDDYFYRCKIN